MQGINKFSKNNRWTRSVSNGVTFTERVRKVVRGIPKGETRTYKEVAEAAGNPRAARAVGAVMRTNYDPAIPCHRVVRSDGTLGDYNRGGTVEKERILNSERSL